VRLPHPRLLVVTDRRQAATSLDAILAACFAAGCRWASVREKDLPAGEQVALARRLASMARDHDVRLALHGDPALAREAGLDAVHLPAGGDVAAARALLGKNAFIGTSVHAVAEAEALDAGLADYAMAGPAYVTASKPGYGPALGPGGIGAICRASAVPIVAIGGITPSVVGAMLDAGAAGVAVMGSVMRSGRPANEIDHLLAAFPRNLLEA
jgi:thiamine-phosphate pyrophosphorylase